MSTQDIITRACDPRVGDRFVKDAVIIEALAIDPNTEARTDNPAYQSIVEFSDSRHASKPGYLCLGDYQRMVTNAMHSHGTSIFHAVEDDEDE